MKIPSIILLVLTACVAYSMPMKETKEDLQVTLCKNSSTCNAALLAAYDSDRVAATAYTNGTGMLSFRFREGIASDHRPIGKSQLFLSISGVISRVTLKATGPVGKAEFRDWDLTIHPDYLERASLELFHMITLEGGGDAGHRQTFNLKLNGSANK